MRISHGQFCCTFGPQGLMVRGETRRGKTRCVLKRLATEGRTFHAMTSIASRSSA
jgi:hypothetical protein